MPDPRTTTARRRAAACLLSLVSFAAVVGARQACAQDSKPEFVKQGLLVPPFAFEKGLDPRSAMEAGDAAREALKDRTDGREAEVIRTFLIRTTMERAGYRLTDNWLESDVQALGRHVRADEYLLGHVKSDGANGRPAEVGGTLVLMRDFRIRQPLPSARAARLDDAAKQLGFAAAVARAQMPHVRRCENALRDGNAAAAVRAARAGVGVYPRGTLARTCLLWALRQSHAPPAEVVTVAREILEVDPTSYHALESTALALDSLRRPADAAPFWVRLASTDTANLELRERVLHSLYDGGSLEVAAGVARQARTSYPDYLPFTRHQWRIAYDRRNWPETLAAGGVLLRTDTLAVRDPVFFRRLATAYRAAGQPYKAVEIVARGVSIFPQHARLYSLYTQYVMAEADTVLPRGLALFPRNGELLALHAQHLRSRGNLAASVDAMRLAIAADSTIPDAVLMLAQAEFELGRPDSALVSLRRALSTTGDSARIAQFAFARGSALYRAAQGTRASADFLLGLRFVSLADSVRSTAQTRLLLGLTAVGAAQAAFTEAVADTDTARRCGLARQATAMLPLARASLADGREVSSELVDQGLSYLAQLEPYSVEAVKGLCP